MRPLKLSMQGFTCFRQHTEVDFEHLELFAIEGPTGSGKSSLLDAMIFALYGQTPRLGKTGHASLIAQGERALAVSFEFAVGEGRYRVARTRGQRQGESEVRFEAWNGERYLNLTENKKAETESAIQKVLSLDFDSFIRAIVLPQGKFDELLKSTSTKRRELLGFLIGLEHIDKMKKLASQREGALKAQLRAGQAVLEGEYAQLSAALLKEWRQEIRETKQELRRSEEARAQLSAWLTRYLPLAEAHERTQQSFAQASQDLETAELTGQQQAQLRAQAAQERELATMSLLEAPALEAQAEELREAVREQSLLRRYGADELLSHPEPLTWNEDAYLQAREQMGLLEQLTHAEQALASQVRELQTKSLRLAQDTEHLAAWQTQQSEVKKQGELVRAEHEVAARALQEARTRAGLAAWHPHLEQGQPCPLCEQTVRSVPKLPTAELEVLEEREQQLSNTLIELRQRFMELQATIKATQQQITRDRADIVQREEVLQSRASELQQQRQAVDSAAADTAQRLLAGLAARLRLFGQDLAQRRAALLTELERRRQRLLNAERAEGKAAALEGSAQAAKEFAQRNLEQLRDQLQSTEQQLVQLRQEAALPADLASAQLARLEAELGELRQVLGAMEQRLADGEAKLARKVELEAKATELAKELDTWATLASHLRADQFQQYLLSEVEAQLLERAGLLLFEISDGRYRLLLEDGDYNVQDLWNAGETRAVKTLSGGETFLASLALAIALSDYLAGNQVLGALFLDEGFGTLDPQALEAVAASLERLRTSGRVVGVITHVAGLSERMPARILVTKSVAGSRAQRIES